MNGKLRSVSDEQLASLIAERCSEPLCEELYQRYARKVYLWCYRYVNNSEDAVDLAQEVFIKVFSNIDSFAGISAFSSWVYSVARNHCLGRISRRNARIWSEMLQLKEEIFIASDGGGAARRVEINKDLERILDAAGEVMREEELQAFILRYLEGLKVKEITRILRCENITGARTLIQNARRKFSKLVEEKGFEND